MRKYIIFLFAFIFPMMAISQVKKIAILETVDKNGDISYAHKLMLRASLSKAITNTEGYEAYDRTDIDAIMGEQNFQRTGMVSDDQIRQLGEMTGAMYILIAEAAKVDNANMFITAKILNVETAKTEMTDNVLMANTPSDIQHGCESLANKLLGVGKSNPTKVVTTQPQATNRSQTISSGKNYIENALNLNMEMVYVEGGTFMMGATSEQGGDARNEELPAHNVQLDSYYIGAHEVTQAQWQAVMGNNPSHFKGDDFPVEQISWEEAIAFCGELSRLTGKTYTLPTEAQWEYAARGGQKSENSKYSGSFVVDVVAWYSENSATSKILFFEKERSHSVGTKRPNELGIYDMSGNVWEWCSDWYGNYSYSPETNPIGPVAGEGKVIRGGSWYDNAASCRVSSRRKLAPSNNNSEYGFRIVCIP
ncbi:MAG: formylglycine-generating enzyme family protein [Bacteroidales bacterium]|nr:formylglycine-generating enzyme family protein [Bacteroidales bacterium]